MEVEECDWERLERPSKSVGRGRKSSDASCRADGGGKAGKGEERELEGEGSWHSVKEEDDVPEAAEEGGGGSGRLSEYLDDFDDDIATRCCRERRGRVREEERKERRGVLGAEGPRRAEGEEKKVSCLYERENGGRTAAADDLALLWKGLRRGERTKVSIARGVLRGGMRRK